MRQTTAKQLQERMRKEPGYVRVNGRGPRLWPTITEDFAGCLLIDLLPPAHKRIEANEIGESNVCTTHGMGYCDTTIVTSKFRRLEDWGNTEYSLGAGIQYVLHGLRATTMKQVDALPVRSIKVHTPRVGRLIKGLQAADEESRVDWFRRLCGGDTVALRLDSPDLRHGEWRNTVQWTHTRGISKDGLKSEDWMVTTIPVNGRGHTAFLECRELARAYLVMALLFNGGVTLDWYGLAVDIGRKGIHHVDMSFPLELPTILKYTLSRSWSVRNVVKTNAALDEIGTEGIEQWLSWWRNPDNAMLLQHWLDMDDGVSPYTALEVLAKTQGWRLRRTTLGDYAKVFGAVASRLGMRTYLKEDFDEVCEAVMFACNRLKHPQGTDFALHRSAKHFARLVEAWLSFIVNYAVLVVAGVGKGADVERSILFNWDRLVKEGYEGYIKPAIRGMKEQGMSPRGPKRSA